MHFDDQKCLLTKMSTITADCVARYKLGAEDYSSRQNLKKWNKNDRFKLERTRRVLAKTGVFSEIAFPKQIVEMRVLNEKTTRFI